MATIAFAARPAYGHVHPLLLLAEAVLRARGKRWPSSGRLRCPVAAQAVR